MKISFNWLGDYVAHRSSPEEIAGMLTMSGLEVEGLEPIGDALEGVVVGHVLETRPHPNADRLTLCRVDLGGGEPVQILCGAPNVAPGQKVPVATLGTTLALPDRENPVRRVPVTLEKRKIRGEWSEGMICAEDELGLSDNHSGIMVLPNEAPVGQPFGVYLESRGLHLRDTVLDVSVTPNRPDAVSHIGIARDVAALTGTTLNQPALDLPEPGGEAAEQVRVDIEAPEACPRYVALLVRGVQVGESPEWLKRRLTAVGLRPRNNIVDVTNYVMYECGQPLHAFDLDRLAGPRIVVRAVQEETPFTTLDGKTRRLPAGTLLICDAERPVAVAGVMGGENSEVSAETTNVLIESAYFDPAGIRRTARALGLQTDASYRFERGVDPLGAAWAAVRAAQLMVELAGGQVVPGLVDAFPRLIRPRQVILRPTRVNQVLGVEIPTGEIIRLLEAIGFEVRDAEDTLDDVVERLMDGARPGSIDGLQCLVPTFRPDIEREVDVIEEVARLYGFDRIPELSRSFVPYEPPRVLPVESLRSNARLLLAGLGFREIYTNSMLREDLARAFAGEGRDVVQTLNPISQEMTTLRPSLLPGLLQVMGYNRNRGRKGLRFFEFGHVFHRAGDDRETLVSGYEEHETLLIAAGGPARPGGWDTPEQAVDLYDVKGHVDALLAALRLADVRFVPAAAPGPLAVHRLEVQAGGTPIGSVSTLAPPVQERFDLTDPVVFAELNWEAVAALIEAQPPVRYRPFSRFPVVERDLALVVDREVPVGRLLDTVREAGGALLRNVTVFDLYRGDRVGPGRQSVALSLQFGADRTLVDEEVGRVLESIVRLTGERHGAVLRK